MERHRFVVSHGKGSGSRHRGQRNPGRVHRHRHKGLHNSCSDGPLIATIGVSDLVVVAAKDAVMVCPKDRAQEVKQVVEQLKAQGREELT